MMKLHVKNFAKIGEANIEINGITVIAGENNSGKTTIGKIVYSIFNCFQGLDKKVYYEQLSSIILLLSRTLRPTMELYKNSDMHFDRFESGERIAHILVEKANKNEINNVENILEVLNKENMEIRDSSLTHEEILDKILMRLTFPRERTENRIVSSIFESEFNKQITPLLKSEGYSKINLEIRNNDIELVFDHKGILISKKYFDLVHDGIYIDNPFLLDDITKNQSVYSSEIIRLRKVNRYNRQAKMLHKLSKSFDYNDNAIEKEIYDERIFNFVSRIKKVTHGDFVEVMDEFFFKEDGFSDATRLSNLSTGLKSFVILLKLLMNNDIKDKSIIILDEPEVHLHPNWQLQYAELLVLLQKEFNLNLIVTTHSPYFINAIQVYSSKYSTEDKCNYYLSYLKGNRAYFKDTTLDLKPIYELLYEPLKVLENIMEEVEADESQFL